jgi:hypothetical protein
MDKSYLLLTFLLFGHILGDFYFQPKTWVDCRNINHFRSLKLLLHALVHGVITTIIVYLYTHDYSITVKSGISILVIHYLVDLAKSHLTKNLFYFIIDQILHVITLYILWIIITQQDAIESILKHIHIIDYKVVIVVLAYVIVWKPISIFITMVLSQWSSTSVSNESLVSAGETIGKIERILILTFILCNQFSGIGFLLAAKSVFRFGDLTRSDDKKMTEYVMLGTLTSVAVTIFIGLAVGYLIDIFPYKK